MRSLRVLIGMLLVLAASHCFADGGTIQLTLLPAITVADGRSTITISAYVRRSSGQSVPDGTPVMFTTSLGTIKDEPVVQTSNGVARAILQSGVIPGTAKVTVQALTIGAITTTDVEFLSDRSLLSSAKEYVEIVAPGYMMFSLDQKILDAAGPNHGAKLRYREIEIEADDLEFNISAYEVRAKKAHLKMGKVSQDFNELNLKLTSRKGIGTTTIVPKLPVSATAVGEVPWFVATHPYVGLADVRLNGVTPYTEELDSSQFKFTDLTDSTSMVSAKKAIVFPQKKIQFQKASLIVGGATILRMPLYEAPLNSATNIITENIFGIQNNQLNVDYPYYLTLKPGETSLFRFTTGAQYGRGSTSANRSLALSYELNWNRGDENDGGLQLLGTSSRSWDLSAHQYFRFDERTSATAFFDLPEGQSAYGNVNFSKQFDGFGMNLQGSTTHTIRGNRFDTSQVTFVVEKDPIKIGNLPLRFTYGVNANTNDTRTSLASQGQDSVGVHLRTQLLPIRFDNFTQFNSYFTATEQEGHNSIRGLALQGNAMLSRQFKNASAILTYDYLQNGFGSGLIGRHQLSLAGNLHQGNFGSTVSATKALDIDRVSVFADLGYTLSHLWRLSYSYTLDRYIGNTYVDYTAALGYRIGIREVGLTFSGRTRHFGIQLLGASIGN